MQQPWATYLLAFFFSASSLMFACPDVYSLPSYYVSPAKELAVDSDPCRDMDRQPSHAVCYSVLHDRLVFPASQFPSVNGQATLLLAMASPPWANVHWFSISSATIGDSPPKFGLTVLYHVIRI
jgi:hypothetical protein